MAVGDATNIFHLDGQLIANPTDLSTSALAISTGTQLGQIRSGAFAINQSFAEEVAEEFGGKRVDYVRTGDAAALTAVLREFDAASLSLIFPNVATSSTTGKPIIRGRSFATTASGDSIARSGNRLNADSMTLLFLAASPEQVPSILLYAALPRLDTAQSIALSNVEEAGFPVAFEAVHNAEGYLYEMALLTDLTLSPT